MLSPKRATAPPLPSSATPFPRCSPAATCWPAPRPAPARPRPSCCRSCRTWAHPQPARAPRALVLTPTRELAAQVAASAADYGRFVEPAHRGRLRRRERATADRSPAARLRYPRGDPGATARSGAAASARSVARCSAWCSMRPTACWTWASSTPSARSSSSCRAQRQNLMFSATYSDDIRALAERMLRDPVAIQVARAQRHGRARRAAGLQGAEGAQASPARAPDPATATGSRCSSSRAPSTAPTA